MIRRVHDPDACVPKLGGCLKTWYTKTSPVVRWLRLHLSMQGAQVQSLVGELRPHMPYCVTKNNNNRKSLVCKGQYSHDSKGSGAPGSSLRNACLLLVINSVVLPGRRQVPLRDRCAGEMAANKRGFCLIIGSPASMHFFAFFPKGKCPFLKRNQILTIHVFNKLMVHGPCCF